MKSHLIAIGCVLVGVAIGFVGGRRSSENQKEKISSEQSSQERFQSLKSDLSLRSTTIRNSRKQLLGASDAEIPQLLNRALSAIDLLEGKALYAECLMQMTPQNRVSIMAEFANLSQESGRDPSGEWKLALERCGQVDGENAMNELAQEGLDKKSHEPWHTLYGWANVDPKAALNWLENQESLGEPVSQTLYEAIIAGAALKNPQEAIALLDEIPIESRGNRAGHLTWNLVQHGGIQALDGLLDYAANLDQSDHQAASFVQNIVNDASSKMLWTAARGSGDVDLVQDVIQRVEVIEGDPLQVTSKALHEFRWQPVGLRLDILEFANSQTRNPDLIAGQLDSLLAQAFSTQPSEEDEQAIRQWQDAHPDSPLSELIDLRLPPTP